MLWTIKDFNSNPFLRRNPFGCVSTAGDLGYSLQLSELVLGKRGDRIPALRELLYKFQNGERPLAERVGFDSLRKRIISECGQVPEVAHVPKLMERVVPPFYVDDGYVVGSAMDEDKQVLATASIATARRLNPRRNYIVRLGETKSPEMVFDAILPGLLPNQETILLPYRKFTVAYFRFLTKRGINKVALAIEAVRFLAKGRRIVVCDGGAEITKAFFAKGHNSPRRLFATWIEAETAMDVPELRPLKTGKIINRPKATPISVWSNTVFNRLEAPQLPTHVNICPEDLEEIIFALDEKKNDPFLVLSNPDGDFAQCLKTRAGYKVEWRDNFGLTDFNHFDHWVALNPNPEAKRRARNLNATETAEILSAFIKKEGRPKTFQWKNINAEMP